jgi:prepilin-type N-terminal cleavage/methylation domain-containing protein
MRRARSGFTLLETVVTMTIVSIVLGAISFAVVSTQRELTRQREAMKHDDTVRAVDALVTRLLRNGRADPRSVGPTVAKINFNPQGRAVWNNVRVRSDFHPVDGAVTGDLEDVLIDHIGDTIFVRWRAGTAAQRYAYPVKLFRLDAYRLDNTAVTDTALSDQVRKVKITIEVPKSTSATEVVRRERWVFLRN